MKQKRKVLSLLLVAIMFIVNVVPALAEIKPLMISELGSVNLENGKDAEMNFEIENITTEAQRAYLITALYNEQTNEMMHYNYLVKTIEGKSKEQWGACLPIPEEGDYKVKVFAWEDMQNLKLVSNVLEVGSSIKPQQSYEKILTETSNYLANQTPSALESVGGEWSVLGLARVGAKVNDTYYQDYYRKVVEVVKVEASQSRPFGGKITEVQRLAIALTAMGIDATNVAGVDLVDYTWNKAKYFSSLPPAQQELGGRQGLNELVFGLITVDLIGFSQPEQATITRDQIIHKILTEYRTADGGFSLMKGASKADVDMTAMALQALAPYYETKLEVKKAVNEALETLSRLQLQTGGFTGGTAGESSATSESTAQVVVALTALGIDLTTDARFIKNGNNPITDLLSYYRGEGQFAHIPLGEVDMMATEQCHYALVAYDRWVKEQNRLYDMSDVEITTPPIEPGKPDSQIIEITNQDLVANRFETYYWIKEATYQIGGEEVAFIDNETIQYGGQTEKLRNKCISYVIQAGENNTIEAGEEIKIVFDGGIEVPIGSVSGQWNSNFEGVIQMVYQTNIPGLTEVRSENGSRTLNQIAFTLPQDAKGTYRLTKGSIYEKANAYSPGIPGIGKEGYFGTLPPIELTVGESTVAQPIGEVTLSIEKRTIGKGDTLQVQEVQLFEGDTAWDIIKREAEKQNIAVEYSESGQYGSIYIASVDGDGEFDYGSGSGWKYSVNEVFPDKGISLYTLKANDHLRLRYCVTVASTELEGPLVKLLAQYLDEAKDYNQPGYTEESFRALAEAIKEAEVMISDSKYNSTEAVVELEVSEVIGQIIAAIKGLELDTSNPLPPSEIPADFANNIGLNKDFLKMQVGETYQIIARRLDEIIDNPINNSIAHPTYHYEVVRGDSVTVSTSGKVMAEKVGQSIIAVTYDAVESNGRRYGAISPINTGLFVVEVTEGNDTGIEISIMSEEDGVVRETRSYDTYYFTEGDTIDYSFSVEATNSDAVEVKVNGKVITPQGSIYTAPLGNSGNIIEVKATNNKGTETFAQVVDARKIEMIIENKSDPTRHDDIQVGDEVSVKFKGITPPVYKLATIYNPSFYDPWVQIGIKEEYGTKVAYTNDKLGGTVLGKTTQWDLATNNAVQFRAQEEGIYTFTGGHIDQGWWGEVLGEDKNMSGPDNPNLGAAHHHGKFSQLPDFTVEVNPAVERPVTGVTINKAIPEIEIGTDYQMQATIQPANATNQVLVWHSNQPEIATVEATTGRLQAIAVGEAEVMVGVKGTDFTDQVVVKVIPELPATEAEKANLKRELEWVKTQSEQWYTVDSWNNLQGVVSRAETIYADQTVLLAEVEQMTVELKRAIKALVRDFEPGLTLSPDVIYPGDRVTLSIPALVKPEYIGYPLGNEMYTVYESDIEGLEKVRSKDGASDGNVLQTITFTIPETTTAGVYTLKSGRIEASSFHPQLGYNYTEFYVDQMPEITIHIVPKSETIKTREIQAEVSVVSYEKVIVPMIGRKSYTLRNPMTLSIGNKS